MLREPGGYRLMIFVCNTECYSGSAGDSKVTSVKLN